jgi:hypothetical protein
MRINNPISKTSANSAALTTLYACAYEFRVPLRFWILNALCVYYEKVARPFPSVFLPAFVWRKQPLCLSEQTRLPGRRYLGGDHAAG